MSDGKVGSGRSRRRSYPLPTCSSRGMGTSYSRPLKDLSPASNDIIDGLNVVRRRVYYSLAATEVSVLAQERGDVLVEEEGKGFQSYNESVRCVYKDNLLTHPLYESMPRPPDNAKERRRKRSLPLPPSSFTGLYKLQPLRREATDQRKRHNHPNDSKPPAQPRRLPPRHRHVHAEQSSNQVQRHQDSREDRDLA